MRHAQDIEELRGMIGGGSVQGQSELAGRDPGWDARNLRAFAAVRPDSPDAVANLLRWCCPRGIPVVPHGGRTGLVGGAVTNPETLICDLGALDRIEEIDPVSGIAVVQAGVTLGALQEAASAFGLDPAIDLAARGSATVGGLISSNAGGIMAFRSGVMRHRVLGLEAVLPDGSIFSDLTRVMKTSAGYDLKHLFIGAEGTLGIVTRAVIKLEPLVRARATALVGVDNAAAAQRVVTYFLSRGGTNLRAAEIMWRKYAQTTGAALGFEHGQLPLDADCLLALELGGDSFEAASAALEDGLAAIYEDAGIIKDGVVAGSVQQADRIWRVREDTEILYRLHPQAPSFDVSVPGRAIDSYVDRLGPALRSIDPPLDPYVFGHLADGNLHIVLNIEGPLPAAVQQRVEEILYGPLDAIGGCFSAEHGIGLKKRAAFERYADPVKQKLSRAIKGLLDPKGLLNPGKVVDPL
ncbi:FAD-binding oxidoreductase [Microvirga sp. M2]|uniref:FAD-binding oxidoreductase n=1 Tax=Microvirga sp. M2 TaxID=3073270 RepID=UPI0039C017DF